MATPDISTGMDQTSRKVAQPASPIAIHPDYRRQEDENWSKLRDAEHDFGHTGLPVRAHGGASIQAKRIDCQFVGIDYAARMLRPVSIAARVSENGLAVIESVYPAAARVPETPNGARQSLGAPGRIVHHQGRSGIVLAVNLEALVAEARRLNGVIEFVPQVGDFVAVGDPIFDLYGGAVAVDDRTLREAAALGPERTLEQDPMFVFRILVDIAAKALSKAINDPTTAVLVIDQLHRLLRVLGKRDLRNENVPTGTGNCAPSLGRRTGKTSSTLLSGKSATTARKTCKSRGGCVRWAKTFSSPCPSIAMPPCTSSLRCWIANWSSSTRSRRIWRSPGLRMRKAWVALRGQRCEASGGGTNDGESCE